MSTNEKPRRSPASPKPAPQAETPESERIAKYLARAGVCSRRDAEQLVAEGKVAVDGVVLDGPAFKVTGSERITVDGKLVGSPQKTRLWRFNKPRGLVVSHKDEQGRPTVFDMLKSAGLPRVISIGRLDLNSEGLLLVTNDGALARKLELPENAWVRRYKVRVAGEIDVNRLEALKKGITIEGVRYGSIDVEVDRIGGLNAWLYVSLTEGKNREIRRVMEHLRLSVNRLQRVSYGPFDLDHLAPGDIAPIGPAIIEKLMKGEEVKYEKPVPKAKPEEKSAPQEPDGRPPRPGSRPGAVKAGTSKAGPSRGTGPRDDDRKGGGPKRAAVRGGAPGGAGPKGGAPRTGGPKTAGPKTAGPKIAGQGTGPRKPVNGGRDANRRRP
ncbi:MAG: pseudouridine synthase [Zavarzinia sp.]|nr:pseudouridine synthase [Zavarzinia sp.]